jgi:hypothetical protein
MSAPENKKLIEAIFTAAGHPDPAVRDRGKIKEIREYCDSTLVERVLGEFPASKISAVI